MRCLYRSVIALAVSLCVLGLAGAQGTEGPPKPGPEHKALDSFIGKWTGKAEMKPSPFGPPGPSTWTETCEWFEGGFHVVCRSEGSGPTGPMKGISIIGYDPMKKVYTYYGVDNSAWADLATGSVSGKTWTFASEMTFEGKRIWSRFVIELLSPSQQKFRWETSEDGKSWTLVMEGGATK